MTNYRNFGLKMFLGGALTGVLLNIFPNHLLKNESKLVEQIRINQKIEQERRIQKIKQEKIDQRLRKRDLELMLALEEERLTKKIISNNVEKYLKTKSLKFIANDLENHPNVTFDILKENWKTKITENLNIRAGLEKSLARAEEYIPTIKYEFKEKNVPEKYVFLGIVESGWTNAISKAGAKGVFQQMSRTAKSFGAIINKNYDERSNIFLTTQKTASILGYLYDNFEDRDLALAAYNSGGLPWGYLKEVKKSKKDGVNLEGYLRFLGRKIKRNSGNKRLLSNIDENLNFLKKNIVLFDVLENRYPEIFNLESRKETRKIYEISKPFEYKVQRGDSWWKVAEEFARVKYGAEDKIVTNRIFKFMRRKFNYRILHPGQKISFKGPNTLRGIEYQTRTNLRKENLHVRNYRARLPNGAKILLKGKQY